MKGKNKSGENVLLGDNLNEILMTFVINFTEKGRNVLKNLLVMKE